MFKHVIKKAPSEGSSSGSERDPEENVELSGEEEEFTGFGEEEGGDEATEGAGGLAAAEAAFWDEEDEELPANLPTLQDAAKDPIFEAKADPKGRKTLICVMCPDKVLREGTMREVHASSSSHKRRVSRYASYLKSNPEVAEETADPRRVSAFLDAQLRLRKSGGAGFVVNPTGNKRKRRRNKKKTDEEKAEAAAKKAKEANEADEADGIAEVSGMKAMNAQQKRKAKQNENKAKGKEGKTDSADASPMPEAKEAAKSPKKEVNARPPPSKKATKQMERRAAVKQTGGAKKERAAVKAKQKKVAA